LKKDDLTFAMFFSIWAVRNDWEVPDIHFTIIDFLENSDAWEHSTGVLQAFRGCSKSTIIALYIVYKLVKDPTLRFLVQSCNHATAKKISRDCQGIIMNHPLAVNLHGAEKSWMVDQFFVRGSTDNRNPSVLAHGVMANITGARADFVIFDDVEVPRNTRTAELRDLLRWRMSESTHVLVPGGKKLFIGTPHAFESIYPELIEKGCSFLKIPLLKKITGEFPYFKGKSSWSERFDDNIVAERQLSSRGKGEFLSQYQLLPHTVDDSILDPVLLEEYTDEVIHHQANNHSYAKIGDNLIVSVSCFWDVSVNRSRGDDSVLAIVYTSDKGKIFIHRTIGLQGDINQQVKQIKEVAIQFFIPLIVVETNGVGAFAPAILLRELNGMQVGVDGRATTTNKTIRIMENFETPLTGGFLHASRQVIGSKFSAQLRDFQPGTNRDHDDFIDAAASAIANESIRIGAGGIASPVSSRQLGDPNIACEMTVDMFKL